MDQSITASQILNAIKNHEIDKLPWQSWQDMPSPSQCREIKGPKAYGVYQIRNKVNKQFIQFGIGNRCEERMKSLFPKPYGVGTRNNESKRTYILSNWEILEYRTLSTIDRPAAKLLEDYIKSRKNHLFNT